jgi:hypothetical protein
LVLFYFDFKINYVNFEPKEIKLKRTKINEFWNWTKKKKKEKKLKINIVVQFQFQN